jgi:predicted lipoprotein with Yx(FWY)xxD motif
MNAIANRTTYSLTLLALIGALAIAGCGGGDGTGGAYGGKGSAASSDETTVEAAPNPEEGATFVSVASVPGLGQVLVDSRGLTLYDFHADKGTTSSCYGECAEVWPPLLSEDQPHASNGAEENLLGTTKRKDGTTQVTYAGHPLYTYVEDKNPGDANGNDIDSFGGEWYALTASGAEPGGSGGAAAPPTSY